MIRFLSKLLFLKDNKNKNLKCHFSVLILIILLLLLEFTLTKFHLLTVLSDSFTKEIGNSLVHHRIWLSWGLTREEWFLFPPHLLHFVFLLGCFFFRLSFTRCLSLQGKNNSFQVVNINNANKARCLLEKTFWGQYCGGFIAKQQSWHNIKKRKTLSHVPPWKCRIMTL